MVSLDPTAGHEQRGHRPVLLVSPGEFNLFTGVPVVLPITSGGGLARVAGFAVLAWVGGVVWVGWPTGVAIESDFRRPNDGAPIHPGKSGGKLTEDEVWAC